MPQDGPRYVVGVQDIKDDSCYKDTYETNRLVTAKEKMEKEFQNSQRNCIIYDREAMAIIHRMTVDKSVADLGPKKKTKDETRKERDSYFE